MSVLVPAIRVWTALLLLAAAAAASAADDGARPNILLLVAEDLSPRIGAFDDAVAQTPHLDELARQSVRYTRTFTTAGVCAPSRAALITGQHQISFGAQHMRTSTGPLGEYFARPEVKAFPELLRAAGYFTFTDTKLDYQFSGIRAGSGPFTIWDEEGARAHWRNRSAGQPFFGLINFLETHESGVMRMDVEPFNAAHAATQRMRAQAGLVADPVTDPDDVIVPPWYPDVTDVRIDMARHYDNIHAMDQRVGAILRDLAADGLLENTIVIWTADHGDGLPRAKRDLFDTGIHVPMLVRMPTGLGPDGWRPGGTDTRLVSFVDFAPTILQWAGVESPAELHGVNFLASDRRYVFASRDRIDEVPDRQRAVRDARYKYIRSWHPNQPGGHHLNYRDGLTMMRVMREMYEAGQLEPHQAQWFEAPGEERLFDLEADPGELRNLNDDPALRETRRRLRNALIDWLARVGDTSTMPEADLRAALLTEGSVPVTPAPTFEQADGQVKIRATDGASIGYRLADGPWQLYTEPLPASEKVIEAKAVHYGWRESAVVASPEGP